MTDWTDHVKKFASKNGISYKEAMTKAKESYKPKETGKMKEPKEKKESKPREKKEKMEKKEKEYEKPEGEKVDEMKVKHTQKKRVSSAEAMKPKKMAQLM
jgi:hypothetical protein